MKKTLPWKIYSLFALFLIAIYTILTSILVLIGNILLFFIPKVKQDYDWAMGRSVARFMLFLYGCKPIIDGFENLPFSDVKEMGKFTLVSNHTSMLDIVCLIAYGKVRAGFIAKKSLGRIPLLHYYMCVAHCVFIDRRSIHSNIDAIKRGAENIKKGIPMLIFSEGTRSKTGEVGEFKHGSMKLSLRSESPIVPVAIKGLREYLEGRYKLSRKGFPKSYITYLPCIDISALSDSEKDNIAEDIRNKIVSHLDDKKP